MRRLVTGILAHVDAGKTTLSEALLYQGGVIKKMGRVDKGDAFLDTAALEKQRGITIYSKQAVMTLTDKSGSSSEIILLDTPGHVDFSAEAERVLNVLDVAVLVVSAVEGVQPHTRTIWKLLKAYDIPTVIFVNKTDIPTADRDRTLVNIRALLSEDAVCFDEYEANPDVVLENVAATDEGLMEEYLERGALSEETLIARIKKRKLFPVITGSALKGDKVSSLTDCLCMLAAENTGETDFGAYCYKISRDEKNVRLSHLKILGGCLNVKELLGEEKVNEIRIYSGGKYKTISTAEAGSIVTVTGPVETLPGQTFGKAGRLSRAILEPVLSYAVRYPKDVDRSQMLRILKEVEEELPEIRVDVDDEHKELRISLMGEVQTQIITGIINDRYNIRVTFDVGTISYKETIKNAVEGVGHFEPLRHYAEVHLKLEPLENGSGMVFDSCLSEDLLDRNWQRLIRTHLEERVHRGVLTGSPITDMKITLVGGKAHPKHTEGGDFRQATYRAVRQGLMQAESQLLEPYYDFTLELPENMVGRAMTDIDKMNGTSTVTENYDGISVLNGRAPVATMHTYSNAVAEYTGGRGHLSLSLGGYFPCHNTEEVLEKRGYNPDSDLRNPSSSVFCSHGAGTVIEWDRVFEYMHVPLSAFADKALSEEISSLRPLKPREGLNLTIGTEEIDEIIGKVSYANSKTGYQAHKGISADRERSRREAVKTENKEPMYVGTKKKPKYILVDGYNVIFAWKELNDLARDNMDAARDKLLDILCNYQGYTGQKLIVVFDAYRVPSRQASEYDYYNIKVVFTGTGQKADNYIERFANKYSKDYEITVVSSDGMIQIITRGLGCFIESSLDFYTRVNSL